MNYEETYEQILKEISQDLPRLHQAILKHECDKYRQEIAQNFRADVTDWITAVCNHFGTKPESIALKTRKRELREPRQIVQWGLVLGVVPNALSLANIGQLFGQDHATVLHSKKVVNQLCDTDPIFRENIMVLVNEFGWQCNWDPATRQFSMQHDVFTLKYAA